MTRKRLSIFGCHWLYMLLLWKFLSYALARHISCYQSTGFISTFYATSSFFFAEKLHELLSRKIPMLHCGRRSRAFRAVLKRQEVKGRKDSAVSCPQHGKKTSLKWPARRLMWSIRVPRRQNLNNFEQITSYFFKLSKVSEFVLSRRKIHNTSSISLHPVEWNCPSLSNWLTLPHLEPTQIYRFLRTRNAVAVGTHLFN